MCVRFAPTPSSSVEFLGYSTDSDSCCTKSNLRARRQRTKGSNETIKVVNKTIKSSKTKLRNGRGRTKSKTVPLLKNLCLDVLLKNVIFLFMFIAEGVRFNVKTVKFVYE